MAGGFPGNMVTFRVDHDNVDQLLYRDQGLPLNGAAGPIALSRGRCCMTRPHPIVFLVDVDNTLIDNDGIQQDLKDHLEQTYGLAARERYWRILEDLFTEVGYRDYIGALQRYRSEHP